MLADCIPFITVYTFLVIAYFASMVPSLGAFIVDLIDSVVLCKRLTYVSATD